MRGSTNVVPARAVSSPVQVRAITQIDVAAAMEKDLRDAFKALSLVRADLVATRKAKADMEDQWRALVAQQRCQDAQRGAQLAQIRETFLMREEDFRAQLARSERTFQAAQLHHKGGCDAGADSSENGPEREDNQREMDGDVVAAETSNEKEGGANTGDDNQELETVKMDRERLLVMAAALTVRMQEQSDTLVEQDASVAQQHSEWAMETETLRQQVAELHEAKLDLVREKKFMDEKFEFLRVEVDVVKRERDAAVEALRKWEEEANKTSGGSETTREEAVNTENASAAEAASRHDPFELLVLEDNVQKLQEELRVLTAENTATTEKLKAAANALDQERTRVKTLESEVAVLQAREASVQQEKDGMKKQFENERTVTETTWAEEKQALTRQVEDAAAAADARAARVEELERDTVSLRRELEQKQQEVCALASESTDLVQQLQEIRDHAEQQLQRCAKEEETRTKTQISEREKLQHELTTLLASFEAATSENALKMSSLQRTNEGLQRALCDKAREASELLVCEQEGAQRVRRLETAVEMYELGLARCREELQSQRTAVLSQRHEVNEQVKLVSSTVVDRFAREVEAARAESRRAAMGAEQAVSTLEVERSRLEGELETVQLAARTLKHELDTARAECDQLRAQDDETRRLQEDTKQTLEAKEHEIARLETARASEKEDDRVAHEEQLAALQSVHEKALLQATVDQNALAHDVQELKLALHRLDGDLTQARDALGTAESKLVELQQAYGQRDGHADRLEGQMRALELQLMAAEDHDELPSSAATASSWTTLAPQIRELDDFLPQLQLFAGRLQTSLHLCAENARAMQVLSSSSSASPTLLTDLAALLRLVEPWKQVFDVKGLAMHVRLLRRSVLATLAQWFEEGDDQGDATPPPPFTIESQEVAIILQNWTADLEKRRSVALWLKRIAMGSPSNEDDEAPRDDQAGATLELKDMTREVKDAFCMLIVPLLKQNRDVLVRVFTRRVCDIKSSYSPDDACWEMRIHVQFATRQASSQRSDGAAAALTPKSSLRRISSSSSISSIASSASSVASSLSLSSISSASKLQIIQARLQQMQQNR